MIDNPTMLGTYRTLLTQFSKNKCVLDISAWNTGSAFDMAQEASHVVSVSDVTTKKDQDELRALKISDKISLVTQSCKLILPLLQMGLFDVIHYAPSESDDEVLLNLKSIFIACRSDALVFVSADALLLTAEAIRGTFWKLALTAGFSVAHQSISRSQTETLCGC